MRVELHRMSYDVGHLVISSVVHPLHRVEDASLYRFQTIFDMGHSTIQDAVAGVIEKPGLIHTTEVVDSCGIEAVHGFIVGMTVLWGFRLLLF